MGNKMQQEYAILNKFNQQFPGKEKGIQEVCQTSLSVGNKRYRDFLLDLLQDPKHTVLIGMFLGEVTQGHVKSTDINWFNRFKGLAGQEQTVVKQPIKKNVTDKFKKPGKPDPIVVQDKEVDKDDDIDDKIDTSSSDDKDDKDEGKDSPPEKEDEDMSL